LKSVCTTCGGIFDLGKKTEKVKELEEEMAAGDFWTDQESAQKVIGEVNELKSWTVPYYEMKQQLGDLQSILVDLDEEEDPAFFEECRHELKGLEEGLDDLEVRRMLSGNLDSKSCYLSINAGAGGTEACDWAEMLARMYQRWAVRRKWKVHVVDTVVGEVAGIKSITLSIEGPFAYGYCKAEKGVHRLVRISPFDSSNRRHTSFASVDVSPQIEDDIQIEVRSEDVKIDTFRASGAGGQHVNTTDSAVRITHLPTKIVVACQKERSQIQNREMAMKMLKGKLYEREVLEREQELKKISGEKMEIAWGSQIRNYVFQPYTMVKDTRTKYEETNVQKVMDGDLDPFVKAYLKVAG